MILRCRICHANIAAFDPAVTIPPLTGAMFEPLEPGFPPPFVVGEPWETVRCPYCRHHPQGYDPAGRDRLDTEAGVYVLQPAGRIRAGNQRTKRERS